MRGITKRYPGVVANDHIDLDLRQGEIHALLGENGAGKTTLMNILYGLAVPDEGEILVDGQAVRIAGPSDAIARGIEMVHQHFMLIPVLSVAENVVLGEETMANPTSVLWSRLAACRTPMIAAVSGFALGGGCELALICDMIVASEKAEFGQPEITLGIIPGAGGTQRLTRVIGKQRAMELVLTGRRVSAQEALAMGFVNRVEKQWFEAAVELAQVVARRAPIAVRLGKQAVQAADETALAAGIAYERRLYELAMATEDRLEGMAAFIEKRRPEFRGR